MDFADINGRAVIITGLPYPPRMEPKAGELVVVFNATVLLFCCVTVCGLLWPAGRSEDGVFGRGSEETLNCMTMLHYTVIMA